MGFWLKQQKMWAKPAWQYWLTKALLPKPAAKRYKASAVQYLIYYGRHEGPLKGLYNEI
jgi:hypothetical protein